MGTPCTIDVKLAKIEGRKATTIKDRAGGSYKAPVYMVSNLLCFAGLLNNVFTLGWRGRQGISVDQFEQGQETGPSGSQG